MPRAEDDLKKLREKFPWFGKTDDAPSAEDAQKLFKYLMEIALHNLEGLALYCELRAYELGEEARKVAGSKCPETPSEWHIHMTGARLLREMRNAILMGFKPEEYTTRMKDGG